MGPLISKLSGPVAPVIGLTKSTVTPPSPPGSISLGKSIKPAEAGGSRPLWSSDQLVHSSCGWLGPSTDLSPSPALQRGSLGCQSALLRTHALEIAAGTTRDGSISRGELASKKGSRAHALGGRDLCSQLSSLTATGTWEQDTATSQWPLLGLDIWKMSGASWTSSGEGTLAAPFPVDCRVFSSRYGYDIFE